MTLAACRFLSLSKHENPNAQSNFIWHDLSIFLCSSIGYLMHNPRKLLAGSTWKHYFTIIAKRGTPCETGSIGTLTTMVQYLPRLVQAEELRRSGILDLCTKRSWREDSWAICIKRLWAKLSLYQMISLCNRALAEMLASGHPQTLTRLLVWVYVIRNIGSRDHV